MSEQQIKKMTKDIMDSQMVFVDLMGSTPTIIKAIYKALEGCTGNIIPYGNSAREYLRLGKFTADKSAERTDSKMNMDTMKKMKNMADKMGKIIPQKVKDMQNYGLIMKYFRVADKHNIQNMLYLLLREYGRQKELPQPKEPREVNGVYLSDPITMSFYDDFESYQKDFPLHPEKPIVVILFYGHTYPNDTSSCVGMIQESMKEFSNAIPIAVSGPFEENEEKLKEFLLQSIGAPVDLILNFMSFRLGAGPMGGNFQAGINLLQEVDAPYLHPFFMTRKTIQEWEESVQGCTSSEVLISIMLPELDGCIETYPIGAMGGTEYNGKFDVEVHEITIIEERLQHLISRVKKHLSLRKKKNKEKKIAIMCYNYPPGESNLFGGAFLDTFASVEQIIKGLHTDGYEVQPLSKEELMDIFTAGKAVNSAKYGDDWEGMIRYPGKTYKKVLQDKFDDGEVIETWGPAPGNIMTDKGDLFIPGILQGNVFLGLQPSRGIHEEADKVYHDKTIPPHHQYIAVYQWIQKEFQADVIIHVGTHGTLEFLKGKECGMSGNCYPDKLLGDIPHIYLYYAGNPSEATIAKRRSHANLIGYQPPLFVQGELEERYSKFTIMLDNYHQSIAISPSASQDIKDSILKMAEELHMPQNLEEIECELYRMKTSLIPKGLHTFGVGFDSKQAKVYARSLLDYGHGDRSSLIKLIANVKGYNLEQLFQEDDYGAIKELKEEADILFDAYLNDGLMEEFPYIHKEQKEDFNYVLEFGKRIMVDAKKNHEMEGLLRVLEGRYNPAKLAGDIYRHPEILPTGYNLYQFDPRLIPTQTAFERGNQICANTLEMYKTEEGNYPRSTAVILWGLETSRTQGETFSQILSYWGVKISSKRNEWDLKFVIIPMEELRRPRIDVVIHICGFFRDMFPNLIESMDDVLHQLVILDEKEEENYIKGNTLKNYEKLLENGYEVEEAKELARARIFGPGEGEYGTGITGIFETKNWEKEEQIGNVFLDKLQYVYNRRDRGKKVEGLHKENLKSVEIISQVRSSHEYQITDLDHYYEFFGGLAKSVEMVKNQKVKMYITDTTEEKIYSESVEKSIARGVRTRLLNSKWIDGMLEHNYHGVQNISKRFENILGLAATTNQVEAWIYEDLFQRYIQDEELCKKLAENNPYAYMDILAKMMEYYNRGYWQATAIQLDKIKEVYLKVEGDIEEKL
nr:cobaltochelatase subunit CobN [Alkalibaculum sporogenes]